MRRTLKSFYARRTARYPDQRRGLFDGELRRLFERGAPDDTRPAASAWLERSTPEIAERVMTRTGERRYTLDQVLREMVQRSRRLYLVLGERPDPLDETVGSVLRSLHVLQDTRPVLYR